MLTTHGKERKLCSGEGKANKGTSSTVPTMFRTEVVAGCCEMDEIRVMHHGCILLVGRSVAVVGISDSFSHLAKENGMQLRGR